jgi:hypothetical protein
MPSSILHYETWTYHIARAITSTFYYYSMTGPTEIQVERVNRESLSLPRCSPNVPFPS